MFTQAAFLCKSLYVEDYDVSVCFSFNPSTLGLSWQHLWRACGMGVQNLDEKRKDIYLNHSGGWHALNQKNRVYCSVLLKVNVLGGLFCGMCVWGLNKYKLLVFALLSVTLYHLRGWIKLSYFHTALSNPGVENEGQPLWQWLQKVVGAESFCFEASDIVKSGKLFNLPRSPSPLWLKSTLSLCVSHTHLTSLSSLPVTVHFINSL